MSTSTGRTKMKALRFAAFGPPSVLQIEEVAIPEPDEGETLVRMQAAAINPSDVGNVADASRTQLCRELPAEISRALSQRGKGAKANRSGVAPRIWASPMMDLTRNMSLFHRKRCPSNRSS